MKGAWIAIALACAALHPATVSAKEAARTSPEAGSRTYLQNFKDMLQVVVGPVAQRVRAAADILAHGGCLLVGGSQTLREHHAPDVVHALVAKYLARDYRNPVVESEVRNVRFDYLKCMDLYHGNELDAAAKKLVLRPNSTYRAEHPR
ncbi:T6SS amidase immunity protein Tai4 family protein [Burkholderia sp. IDO3]|uniref:T6SS amidase immunity protein Tai4 family protein n=1 Tax=Burkholderia sp. IDO3 TaxID=1705310 RepID=UPI000BBA5C56|nr:T6SS amidase immunity protein Tai4 family protein [Burkholderia sp. IDO3]AXK62424.1 hypothetical protein DCN14_07060 [Burkholderia sp. IDO3]PCD63626.1 hypothetical protein CN645_00535 [Burkholderia sp. IDO3]